LTQMQKKVRDCKKMRTQPRITQAEVDTAIVKFLENGGKIKVLSDEIHYDWEERSNTVYSSYKLFPKVHNQ
jgi:hypothetical protein